MSQAFFGTPARTYSGIELRRSTRIERTVPLFISGRDTAGQDFLERTSAVSVNLHGCRYPSRHDLRVGTWITLQLGDAPNSQITTSVRAQVKSVHLPQSPREMHHIGVELETPGNIWSVPSPPSDWVDPVERGFRGNGETAAATGPARSSVLVEMPKPHRSEAPEPVKAEQNAAEEAEEKEASPAQALRCDVALAFPPARKSAPDPLPRPSLHCRESRVRAGPSSQVAEKERSRYSQAFRVLRRCGAFRAGFAASARISPARAR